MEQRPLRLGDIVDDYCPRERRLTNHAIVAIVEQTIKQTRCTTCDHEHVYKDAKEPRKRKKDQTAALYSAVLSGLQKPAHAPEIEPDTPEADVEEPQPMALAAGAEGDVIAEPAVIPAEAEEPEPPAFIEEDGGAWSMHRRLIRAQLPRTGNEPPAPRPIPEFTIRQPGARGHRQWGRGGGNGNFGGNGNSFGHRGGQGNGNGGNRQGGRGGGRFAPDGNGRGGRGRGGRRPR